MNELFEERVAIKMFHGDIPEDLAIKQAREEYPEKVDEFTRLMSENRNTTRR